MNNKERVMEEFRQDVAMIPEYQEPPVAGAATGSAQRVVGARVVTEYIRPPIPTTAFDWIAYREGQEDGRRGFGRTEAEAITELLESEE